MSTLRSLTDWTGTVVAGVTLGQPANDGTWHLWDHELLPSGVIDADGHIYIEEEAGDAETVEP